MRPMLRFAPALLAVILLSTIIAGPAQQGDLARLWPALAQQTISSLAGPLHQFGAWNTAGNGRPIKGPHLLGGIKGIGQLVARGQRS